MEFLALLIIGGLALTARMLKNWQAWVAWGVVAVIIPFGAWLAGAGVEEVIAWALGSSIFGFVAPELWEALKGFLKQPKVAQWSLAGLALLVLAACPQLAMVLLQPLLAAAILFWAFKLMLKGFK